MTEARFACDFREFHVSTVEEIADAVRKKQSEIGNPGSLLMRGEKDVGYLPTAGAFRSTKSTAAEKHVFFEFLRHLPLYSTVDPERVYDVLAHAQHHGLPTRLLDWTLNPLVAIYFAIEGTGSADAAVWAVWGFDDGEALPANPFKIDSIHRLRPFVVNPRMHAQSGIFTMHPDSGDLRTFLREGDVCFKFVIPAKEKANMRLRLEFLRINHATLFPDLDGLCQWLRWRAFELGT